MERTQLYIPTILKKAALKEAKNMNVSLSEILRRSMEYFLDMRKSKTKNEGVSALLQMAERAKIMKYRGPKDLSINHDEYLYGDKRL